MNAAGRLGTRIHRRTGTMQPVVAVAALLCACAPLCAAEPAASSVATLRVEAGHSWRPPFGLDRVGRPTVIVAEWTAGPPAAAEYALVGSRDGKVIERHAAQWPQKAPYAARASFVRRPGEVTLVRGSAASGGEAVLARLQLPPLQLEAAAVARPDEIICPVDLGTILVPHDWLLLRGGQRGTLQVAAISREAKSADRGTFVEHWYASTPQRRTKTTFQLAPDRRADCTLQLPPAATDRDRDALVARIVTAGGEVLWEKSIPVMLVQTAPQWPSFGACRAKLRYDAPISVRRPDGKFTSMPYEEGWPKSYDDVVVSLPNGSRFVFWRGSCYIPFWVGRHNTGLCYEWAETSPPTDGFADCVEPLMDKQCRYGRVTIVESTPARIHVRWSYQSCDFLYKVWGDSAVEDYYFYPDGFGTRVLTLQAALGSDYELSEFIVMAPQAAFPFDILPRNIVDVLFVDGQKRQLDFPFLPAEQGEKAKSRDVAAIYRVRFHKNERLCGVYFTPAEKKLPPAIFAPFYDRGELVTPCYWGSHWPLARGNTTGGAIDERIAVTPSHNSVMSWARTRPTPLRTAQLTTLDTLGRSKPMTVNTWAWLIGTSDADDRRLLDWAHSYAAPPALAVEGGRLEAESYLPERRAMRLVVERPRVTVTITPATPCVHPVFELADAPRGALGVQLDGRALPASQFAWDGRTLWLAVTIAQRAQLRLEFGSAK